MTDAEINALPAGRGLDVLVAEKVMGLKPHREDVPHAGTTCYEPGSPSRYSESIGAAWQVVEKLLTLLKKDCLKFGLISPPPGDFRNAQRWEAGLYEFAGGEIIGGVDAQADTAPLAICRAALKVVAAHRT
jgi:hypothetical protein